MDAIPNPHPGLQTAGSITVGPAPESMRRVCDKFNAAMFKRRDATRASVARVERPGGNVAHHVRLDPMGGKRIKETVFATDDGAVMAAILRLCARSHIDVPTSLGFPPAA